MSLQLQARTPNQSFFDSLKFDPTCAGLQVGLNEAIAHLLHDIAMPMVMGGETVGNVLFPVNHAMTLELNLFTYHTQLAELQRAEPAVVSIVPDSAVLTFGGSTSQDDNQVVVRVNVRGWNDAIAQTVAWRLYGFFGTRLGFQRGVSFDCDNPNAVVKTDLLVRELRPLEEPAVAERADDRVLMTFRVLGKLTRNTE